MSSSTHNDQYISLYKYIRRGLPSISHSEALHQVITMINLYHWNKYNKSCSDSGIMPHQTAVQENFFGISSLEAVLTLSTASPTPLWPSSLETDIGGAHYSNIQESQTNYWGGSHKSRGNPCVIIRRLSATKPVRHNQETHPSERGHELLQKTQRTIPRQRDPLYSWQGLSNIPSHDQSISLK